MPLYAIRCVPAVSLYSTDYIVEAFAETLGGIPMDLDVHLDLSDDGVAGALAGNASDPQDLIVLGNEGKGAARSVVGA